MRHPILVTCLALLACIGVTVAPLPSEASGLLEKVRTGILFSGAPAASPASNLPATFALYNKNTTGSGQPLTFAMNVAAGDVPAGAKFQVYKADGTTTITTQESNCATWTTDSSRKTCYLAVVNPDSIVNGSYINIKVGVVSGSPSTTGNVTTANITGNTDFRLQVSDLELSDGTAESGTFDFIRLNDVINNCTQFNAVTGYGSNPPCGWEIAASGPVMTRIHAFQYAKRVSDNAIHKWIRTDMWVDFYGSGSTPCSNGGAGKPGCSVSYRVMQPNSRGALVGATLGPSSEPAYIFSATLTNGANVINYMGGANDTRVTALTSTNFADTTTHDLALPAGNWQESASNGTFPIKFTCSVTCPAGLVVGKTYFMNENAGTFLYDYQCDAPQDKCYEVYSGATTSVTSALFAQDNYFTLSTNSSAPNLYYKFCPTSPCVATTSDTLVGPSTHVYIARGAGNNYIGILTVTDPCTLCLVLQGRRGWTTGGTGTTTMIPYVATNANTAAMGLDDNADPFWVDSTGAVVTAPKVQVAHDFAYLMQKSKAFPPYFQAIQSDMLTYGTPNKYWPGAYMFPADMNTSGDGPTDPRIGYLNTVDAYALYQPEGNAAIDAKVQAAGFTRMHMWFYDETMGQPVVFNKGHAKNGVTYDAMGAVAPVGRPWPYAVGGMMQPDTATVFMDSISERYGPLLEPSHMPSPMQAALVQTGAPYWWDSLVTEINIMLGEEANNQIIVSGTTYYRPIGYYNNQTRGAAWMHRALQQALHFAPDSSPVTPYLRDVWKDNMDFYQAYTSSFSGDLLKMVALGFYWQDVNVGGNLFQWWQNDFHWWALVMDGWRGENSSILGWLTNYYSKNVIGRMDTVGGGCLFAGPSRFGAPFSSGASLANLAQDWTTMEQQTSQFYHDNGLTDWPYPWVGCPSSGLVPDGSTAGNAPSGLITFAATSAAMATLIGIPRAQQMYDDIRDMQYNGGCATCGPPPLTFTHYLIFGNPTTIVRFPIGPLGATE